MNFFIDENITKYQDIYLQLDMEEAIINEDNCIKVHIKCGNIVIK